MQDEMTIDDAMNIACVLRDTLGSHPEADVREFAMAATRLVGHIVEQSRKLERERARRRASTPNDVQLAAGHRLEAGMDGGGRRDFLGRRAVHAGQSLYLLMYTGRHPVRYESNMLHEATPVLYLSLPGVQQDVAIAVPRDARFVWPDELRRW
jgi:hypothetical protein